MVPTNLVMLIGQGIFVDCDAMVLGVSWRVDSIISWYDGGSWSELWGREGLSNPPQ